MSECKLTLEEIRDLTPRQIQEIYFHARDKQGAIEVPATSAPATAEGPGRLHQLLGLQQAGLIKLTPEQAAELERRIQEHTRGNADPRPT